jgi:hypothetical protein
MSLSFTSEVDSYEDRWIHYAVLRDCVQHHLEGGRRTEKFRALHSISRAVGEQGVVRIDAAELRGELTTARDALAHRPLSDLAVSLRTRAALAMRPIPDEENTELVPEGAGIPTLDLADAQTLGDIFGRFLTSLLHVAREPASVVEVRDL